MDHDVKVHGVAKDAKIALPSEKENVELDLDVLNLDTITMESEDEEEKEAFSQECDIKPPEQDNENKDILSKR